VAGSTTTVYLEGLWEEVVGGTPKAYYSFNGQTAVMYTYSPSAFIYLTNDHLDSTSVATTQAAAVASQQEFDPWGKVRSSGISATSINYTGQRLDGTGLLYYHARMYDPLLGRFVSADPIAPRRSDPQSRNRYTYTLNNPLKFTDPTGYCSKTWDTEKEVSENFECYRLKQELSEYGLTVKNLFEWESKDLQIILRSAQHFAKAAHWNSATFKNNMTRDGQITVFLHRGHAEPVPGRWADTWGAGITDTDITFYDPFFNSTDDRMRQAVAVHELAHAWDAAWYGAPGVGMMLATGSSYDLSANYSPGGDVATEYAKTDHFEDFAEAVTQRVYPWYASYRAKYFGETEGNIDRARWDYVTNIFKCFCV
jgi:RHS repeat-associated protein